MSFRHAYELLVLEAHLDSFGHMNNATYLEVLEEARWDLITKRGYSYERIHETGVGPTILEINIQFKREIKLRERITIHTWIEDYSKVVGLIQQEMRGPDGDLRCVATFKVALFDIKRRKLIPPTKDWKHAIGMDEA